MTSRSAPMVQAEFPAKLECLFKPCRYKVLYGGRGAAKSWGVARALLIIGMQRSIRVLCAREYQNSIKESVHKLLSDQVTMLGFDQHYDIQRDVIRGPNGTEFFFEGLKHNAMKIKSYEGIDICWVEEAHNVSRASWDYLVPTIRKAGSEIWVTFNPELDEDETYQRFVVHRPSDAIVEKLTWRDNPWFTSTMRQEMEDLKARSLDQYMNVWEGECRSTLDGAVYAEELRNAQKDGRITQVPYNEECSVDTFWDLGWADNTSIWFAQTVGFEYHVIDYYSNTQKQLNHYLKVLQERGYIYGTDWLPWDAEPKQLSTGRSVKQLMAAAGRRVRIVPKLSVADGINAARTIFSRCYFDMAKCEEGLRSLRHYRFEVNADTKTFGRAPVHDWASHGADAFRYLALALKQPRKPLAERVIGGLKKAWTGEDVELGLGYGSPDSANGWMRW